MAKAGYIKHNYIPNDNDDLFLLSQLCVKYMRTYQIRPEQFIQSVLNIYDHCKKHGYTIDISQQRLKEEY